MIKIKGKHNSCKVFTDEIENTAKNQLTNFLNLKEFKDEKVRIMSDVHAGKGCTIGFTSTFSDKIIPNLVGVDINCGVLISKLNVENIDFNKLDNYIKNNIPSGFKVNDEIDLRKIKKFFLEKNIESMECERNFASFIANIKNLALKINDEDRFLYFINSLGSLGGGNHFIEIDKDDDNNYYLVIHTGSRNLGLKVCNYYQKIADEKCKNLDIPKEFSYLTGKDLDDYLEATKLLSTYSEINKYLIAEFIHDFFNDGDWTYEIVNHNYVDTKNKIIRKGAISAQKDELVLIPLNMRDGIILGKGKGNGDWNYSAPHGAGRILSRGQAKRQLNVEDFEKSMSGIYTSCISKETIDESPMVYKSKDKILENIKDTIIIDKIIKSIYNFKAN